MKEKIESKILKLQELYDFYLEKLDTEEDDFTTNRLNELRIEINAYKDCLAIISGE